MGPGTYTVGGRYGELKVIKELCDGSSPSCFRSVIRDSGNEPAFIVFGKGGIIYLENRFEISQCNCKTVAGHSAPPPGITFAKQPFIASCSDFILRYTRFRMGGGGCPRVNQKKGKCECLDGDVVTWGSRKRAVRRVVLDHLSTAWGTDETLSADSVHTLTVSYCFITQALHNSCKEVRKGKVERHGMGTRATKWAVGSQYAMHHNLFSHISQRTPKIGNHPRDRKGYLKNKQPLSKIDKQLQLVYNNVNFGGLGYTDDDKPSGDGKFAIGMRTNFVNNVLDNPDKIFGAGDAPNGPMGDAAGSLDGLTYPGGEAGTFFKAFTTSKMYLDGNIEKYKGKKKNKPLSFDGNHPVKKRKMSTNKRGKKGGKRGRPRRSGGKKRGRSGGKKRRRAKLLLQKEQRFEAHQSTAGPQKHSLFKQNLDVGVKVEADAAQDAYDDVLAHAGVWPLRDKVDEQSIDMIKSYSQVLMDAPGGCCVSSTSCVGVLDIKAMKGCDLRSCNKRMVSDATCKKYQDNADLPFKELNEDLYSHTGIDWENSKWADEDDHSDLEDYLEGCLFPSKGGRCAGSGGKGRRKASPPPSGSGSGSGSQDRSGSGDGSAEGANFVFADLGSKVCPSGYHTTTDLKLCEEGATCLGKQYVKGEFKKPDGGVVKFRGKQGSDTCAGRDCQPGSKIGCPVGLSEHIGSQAKRVCVKKRYKAGSGCGGKGRAPAPQWRRGGPLGLGGGAPAPPTAKPKKKTKKKKTKKSAPKPPTEKPKKKKTSKKTKKPSGTRRSRRRRRRRRRRR